MAIRLSGPVGLRNNKVNVQNKKSDQETILRLLSAISDECGGSRESWKGKPPAAGPDGSCPPELVKAIRRFQDIWQKKGLLKAVDSVVDPDKSTIKHMSAMVSGTCGPRVDDQFSAMLRKIESDFRSWSRAKCDQACTRILIPLKFQGKAPSFSQSDPLELLKYLASVQPDVNGWDVLPLFQGRSQWLRSRKVLSRGCATPSSPKPKKGNMDPAHEDPCTCSNTVEIGGRCWLNGTVNYGTFGMMVRLCTYEFWPSHPAAVLFYAERLIRWYKEFINKEDPTLPIEWTRATFKSGDKGVPPASVAGNRPNCACTCKLDGKVAGKWDYVWEPVKPRDKSSPPDSGAYDLDEGIRFS